MTTQAQSKANQGAEEHTPLEKALHDIWCGVLHLDEIGLDEPFLAIGGNSIKAIEVTRGVRDRLDRAIDFIDVFKYSIRQLAAHLDESATPPTTQQITVQPWRAFFATSPIQKQFLLMEQLKREDEVNRRPIIAYYQKGLVAETATGAFEAVLRRHDILRTVFVHKEREPEQQVRDVEDMAGYVDYRDLSEHADPVASLQALYDREVTTAFDLEKGPLCRILVAKLSPEKSTLLLSMHHALADGHSASILLDGFWENYRRIEQGRGLAADEQPLTYQYKDYLYWQEAWLAGEAGQHALDYWCNKLEGLAPKPFPHEDRQPQGFLGASSNIQLESGLVERLRGLSSEQDVTLFVVMQSYIKAFIYLYSGRTDIAICSPITTRDHQVQEGQIGPYLNTVILRDLIEPGDTYLQLLRRVHETTLEAYKHRLVPMETVMAKLGIASGDKCFDIGFTLQNQLEHTDRNAEEQLIRETDRADDLTTNLWFDTYDRGDRLEIRLYYKEQNIDPQTLESIRQKFLSWLPKILENPNQRLAEVVPRARKRKRIEIDLDL